MNMKKILLMLGLGLCGFFTSFLHAYAEDSSVQVTIDGIPLYSDQPAIIKEDRTLVPFKALLNALGAEVAWEPETQSVAASKNGLQVRLLIGSKEAFVNQEPVALDVAAQIINDRTMVPLAFVSKHLGADVTWDANTRTASVIQKDPNQLDTVLFPSVIQQDPSLPVMDESNITLMNQPLIPAEDTGMPINDIAGIYAAENKNKQKFVLQYRNDGILDILQVSSKQKDTGNYVRTDQNLTITTSIWAGNYQVEHLAYGGASIILLKGEDPEDIMAMTPISYQEFVSYYQP